MRCNGPFVGPIATTCGTVFFFAIRETKVRRETVQVAYGHGMAGSLAAMLGLGRSYAMLLIVGFLLPQL